MAKSGVYNFSHAKLDGLEYAGPIRYFSLEEIEEMSPSWRDGIDLKKERSLQASYCKFLQELGMQLKVSQITISSAMAYCHRFYLQRSHAKNDRMKVYERQQALILLAERVVLVALAFNFSVSLPYRPLLKAVRKFNGADNFFVQVAWNFVNDWYANPSFYFLSHALVVKCERDRFSFISFIPSHNSVGVCSFRTSLCLRCKAQHIAAGAFFLAAKFTKVKLPFEGEFWLQEFNITSQQLEEITSQMMDLYVVRGPLAIECEGSTGHDQITSSTAGGNLVYDSGHSQAPPPARQ